MSFLTTSRGRKVLTVNIDMDDLRYYRGIHALPQQVENGEIYTVALPRFLDLCESCGIRATIFIISSDLSMPAVRKAVSDAVARGHEAASHTRSHDYAVSRSEPGVIRDELRRSKAEIEEVCGSRVVGFRGPGYNLSPDLLKALVSEGFTYDTSIMPSPPYWAARAAVIAWMRLTGRRSTSIVGRARDFARTWRPFEWQGPGSGLIEFPITAGGPLMAPLIGTTMGRDSIMLKSLMRAALRRDFINIEFHAIDFMDLKADGLEPELAVEPALKIPLNSRVDSFRRCLLAAADGRTCPALAELAARIV